MTRSPLLALGLAGVLAVGAAACGDDSKAKPAGPADLTVVAPGGLKFDKTEYTVASKPGGVVIAQVNKDNQTHTLLVKQGSKQGVRIGPRLQDGPGESSQGTYDLKPGTYYVYCDIPGHEASMNATLTVS
jgi:plastocyanin